MYNYCNYVIFLLYEYNISNSYEMQKKIILFSFGRNKIKGLFTGYREMIKLSGIIWLG